MLRSKVTLLFLAFAVAIFAVTGTAMALTTDTSGNTSLSPAIQSDKADYAPGELVTLTGGNWQPGESVNIKVNDTYGASWSRNVDVTADQSGNISDSFNLPNTFVSDYDVTATGAQSGTATTTFTDAAATKTTLTSSPNPSSTGQNVTFTATVSCEPISNGCSFSSGNTMQLWEGVNATCGGQGGATLLGTVSQSSFGGSGSSRTATFTINSLSAGTHSTIMACFNGGGGGSSAGSSNSTFLTQVVSANTAPSVTAQPTDKSITYGQNTTFTASASGTPTPTVQWQKSTDGGANWTNISGATSTTLSLTKPPVSDNNSKYRAVFTNAAGSATSNAATLQVAQKNLTINGAVANSRPYNGTANATVNFTGASLSGVESGDTVTINSSGYSASFDNKNVGTNKPVTVTGVTLGGGSAGNYTVSQPTGLSADITAKNLTVSATGVNKPYDATTDATVTLSSDKLSGDAVTLSYTGASFADKNVGTGKTVTVTGISISGGADAGNYNLLNTTAQTTANITAKDVTGSFTAQDKVWDGTTAATVLTRSVNGAISGDSVSLTGGTANFATAAVGANKTVTLTGAQLGGDDKGNYNLTSVNTTTASILAWNAQGGGFYQPVGVDNSVFLPAPGTLPTVNNSGVWNTIKGGSTVPLKFNVFAGGTEKTSTGDIQGLTTYKLANCTSGGATDIDPVDFTTTDQTSLRYSGTPGVDGQFIQNWKTSKVTSDTCYRTAVTFKDGSSIYAFFKLLK